MLIQIQDFESLVSDTEYDDWKLNPFGSHKIPSVLLEIYFNRLARYAKLTKATVCLIYSYIKHLKNIYTHTLVNKYSIHKLLLVSVVVALKMCEDQPLSNGYMAKVGGIPLSELNSLELTFIDLLDYKLNFDQYVQCVVCSEFRLALYVKLGIQSESEPDQIKYLVDIDDFENVYSDSCSTSTSTSSDESSSYNSDQDLNTDPIPLKNNIISFDNLTYKTLKNLLEATNLDEFFEPYYFIIK